MLYCQIEFLKDTFLDTLQMKSGSQREPLLYAVAFLLTSTPLPTLCLFSHKIMSSLETKATLVSTTVTSVAICPCLARKLLSANICEKDKIKWNTKQYSTKNPKKAERIFSQGKQNKTSLKCHSSRGCH